MIHNPSNDVKNLHQKFNLPSITTRKARQAFEMSIKSGYTDSYKGLVANYLAQSANPEKLNQLKMAGTAITRMEIIRKIAAPSVPGQPGTTLPTKSSKGVNPKEDFEVTLDGDPPKKKDRPEHSRNSYKAFYDKWRDEQQKMRINDVIANFQCRQPSERQVRRYNAKQGWTKNTVTAESVCRQWKPAETEKAEFDSVPMQKLVLSQRWKGLHIVEDPKKGRMVMTTRTFRKGEVVCDYHGIPISFKEGKTLLKNTQGNAMGCLYFYKNSKGVNCCMDGQTIPCPCHPEKETFGRRINHSRRHPNLKSVLKTLTIDGIKKDFIFFMAKTDIKCDQEVTFDYSVNGMFFVAEAADSELVDD
ncbi:uncharacterized protein LOC109615411 [Esox lucius]|uniref:uncharacterized protein LOC109615411 n=1 Tax=Esox lucius TaxID=8010 RepID=UPI0009733ABB|nr:uncharacterized protein LOC109615411 [Esox lucius]